MPTDGAFTRYVGKGKFPPKPRPVIHAGSGRSLCGERQRPGHIVVSNAALSDCPACKDAARKVG